MTPRARFTGNSFLCAYMKALSVLSVISLEDICDKATFTWSNGRASGLPGSTFGRGMGSMSDARSSAIDQQGEQMPSTWYSLCCVSGRTVATRHPDNMACTILSSRIPCSQPSNCSPNQSVASHIRQRAHQTDASIAHDASSFALLVLPVLPVSTSLRQRIFLWLSRWRVRMPSYITCQLGFRGSTAQLTSMKTPLVPPGELGVR